MNDIAEIELGPWMVAELGASGAPVSNGAGVHFQIWNHGEPIACTVSRQALEALQHASVPDLVEAYLDHQKRVDQLAFELLGLGFRAPRVVVRLHHVAH